MPKVVEVKIKDGVESGVKTRKIWNTCEYVWTISSFDSLKNNPAQSYMHSPSFQATTDKRSSVKWYLRLCVLGIDYDIQKGYITVYLDLESASKFPVITECELSFRNSDNKILHRSDSKYCYQFLNTAASKIPVTSVERGLLIKCCVDYIVQIRARVRYSIDELESFQEIDPDPKFSDTWNSILENPKFSDLVLVVGCEEIKAHKVILSSRSPVFMAMFSHDLLENESGKVEISDFSVETIRGLLRFIYTNELKFQDTNEAISLIRAAEKYAFHDLKLLCSDYLKREITVHNTEEMLLLADTHNVLELKQCIMEYITDNPKKFAKLNQFEKVRENPELMSELLSKTMEKFAVFKQNPPTFVKLLS